MNYFSNIVTSVFRRCVFIILASFIVIASTCKKDTSKPCVNSTPYSFNVSSNIQPEQSSYKIGDTLFLTSVFPSTLKNTVTNEQVNYTNSLKISGTFTFAFADTNVHLLKAAYNKFTVIPLIGNFTSIVNTPNNGISCTFVENGNYQFKIGIIPKEKGIFSIGFNDLGSQGLRGKDCTNAAFNMTVANPNKHLDLFQYAIGYAPDAYLAQHIYCFRVN